MSIIGTSTLVIALVAGLYAAFGSLIAIKSGNEKLAESAKKAFYASFGAIVLAALAMVIAFVTHDFSIRYVFEHSSTVMPTALTWVAFYAGNAGSILYLALSLGLVAVVALVKIKGRLREAMSVYVLMLSLFMSFFVVVMLFFERPFDTLEVVPLEGAGLNPLLRHPAMFIHPPLLMAGLVSIAVPFTLVFGYIASGRYDDAWVLTVRKWALFSWFLLGAGILLGAWWAYTILGWGGYWSWDPIENVALMPWLILTAFIHSIMVQHRRGMFKLWNVTLIGIAFILAQLGLYINRGGPVVSVHSFASTELGVVFLSFLLVSFLFTLAIYIWRYKKLANSRRLENIISRETSILLNTFMLLVVTVVVLWGVLFPAFSDVANNEVVIGASFFNRTAGPLLLLTIFLMGVGPLLPWRKTKKGQLWRLLLVPSLGALILVVTLVAIGVSNVAAIVSFGVVFFALLTVFDEWRRGVRTRMLGGEKNPLKAFWKMILVNKPRHGGYVVHISMLVLAFGVVGTQFYDLKSEITLSPNQSAVIGDYRVFYTSSDVFAFEDHQSFVANLEVYSINQDDYADVIQVARNEGNNVALVTSDRGGGGDDRLISLLSPNYNFYFQSNQVAVNSGIMTSLVEDLYIIPVQILEDDRVVLNISINPLAIWLWLSSPFFLIGTLIVLWPSRNLSGEG